MDKPIVSLRWADPQLMEMKGLCVEEDLEGIGFLDCIIVGHLISETEDCYHVAKELWENGSFKYVHMIPKKIVDEKIILVPEKKGGK